MERALSYFSLGVANMKNSLDFYENVIGLKVVYKSDEWSELEIENGVSLALRLVGFEEGGNKYSGIGFRVDDCEKATKDLEAKGVTILTRCQKRKANNIDDSYVILSQVKDPDGNIIFISQYA